MAHEQGPDAVALAQDNDRLRHELADHERRLRELETENNHLANLYVAAHQLHSGLTLRGVLDTIEAILVNLVGAKRFALYLNDGGPLRAVTAAGIDVAALAIEPADGALARTAASGHLHCQDHLEPRAPSEPPLVIVPLRFRGSVAGFVAVWTFLAHKTELGRLDCDLLDFLGGHAASALEAARLAAGGTDLSYAGIVGLL